MAEETTKKVRKDWFEKWLDAHFEAPFFALRYVTVIPVLFAFAGSLVMFAIGGYETWEAIHEIVKLKDHHIVDVTKITVPLIKSIDAFLLGLVLMIFSYGIYDLFVSKLDPAEQKGIRPDWMKFKNMGALKVTLAEVVLIILVITFFEVVMSNMDTMLKIAEVEGEIHVRNIWILLVIPLGVLLIAVGIGLFKKLVHE